ncbi:zinc ABC transporter ATP-binding protein AztA [Thermanaerothrix sp.]|uniref:zinc ABC transporter ATP-binding protein AztA n=1 Tax=Thermanaerothrix sp. TaxID=2972675 RepID=UPI003C7CC04D
MALMREIRQVRWSLNGYQAAHDTRQPIVQAIDLTVMYESGPALERVSFEIYKGERVAVVGPNGAGKSTLFKVIAGILQPTSGRIEIYGGAPGEHICVAYVPQRSVVDWRFPVTVYDVVMMGRVGRIGLLRRPGREDHRIVRQALERVGLSDLASRQIAQLSGGQQQRMFLARALAQEAELMLLDEPFTGLDLPSQNELLALLERLQGEGITIMVSLHDLNLAAQQFTRLLLLNRTLIALGTPQDVLNTQTLLAAYGGHLHIVSEPTGNLVLGDTCCDGGGHA